MVIYHGRIQKNITKETNLGNIQKNTHLGNIYNTPEVSQLAPEKLVLGRPIRLPIGSREPGACPQGSAS